MTDQFKSLIEETTSNLTAWAYETIRESFITNPYYDKSEMIADGIDGLAQVIECALDWMLKDDPSLNPKIKLIMTLIDWDRLHRDIFDTLAH